MLPVLEEFGIGLSGGDGTGEPIINLKEVIFNGLSHCGHPQNSAISIPWPSDTASGVAKYTENVKSGNWFAGAVIDKRCCDGDCSYETFSFLRIFKRPYENSPVGYGNLHFDCCKTAYRPYDLAVNIFLVIASHHLKDDVRVSSDGEMIHWQEAMMLCQVNLGYGLEFKFSKEE